MREIGIITSLQNLYALVIYSLTDFEIVLDLWKEFGPFLTEYMLISSIAIAMRIYRDFET